jgi:hypothetical protein
VVALLGLLPLNVLLTCIYCLIVSVAVKVKVVVPVKVPDHRVNVLALSYTCPAVTATPPRLMFHWLVKWKRYNLQLCHLYLLPTMR